MLSMYVLSKYGIRPSNIVLSQWINITVRSCTSSSDSSSDSDSDNEKAKPKRIHVKNTDTDEISNAGKDLGNVLNNTTKQMAASAQISKGSISKQLLESKKMNQKPTTSIEENSDVMEYINNMMEAKKLKKTIDVAMPRRDKLKDTLNKDRHIPYEKRLTKAAEDVANRFGENKTSVTHELLQKAFMSNVQISETERLTKLQKREKIERSVESQKQEDLQTESYATQKSVIRDLLDEYKKQSVIKQEKQSVIKQEEQPVLENSVSRQLLNNVRQQNKDVKRPRFRHGTQNIDLWNGKPSGIFNKMGTASPDTPELKTWTTLQQTELKVLTIHSPANIFQEMILWTEQGKLWKFPIDNEQGMEEEHNVHFSEHVFMERHLKDWCPKSGPLRHFMELVCIGLSKNPYMTVEEKVSHIMWYKEYFESKQGLLKELGAIQESSSDKVKEIQG